MNQVKVRKLRQILKRDGRDYIEEIKAYPFWNRWGLCWHILFGRQSKGKKNKKMAKRYVYRCSKCNHKWEASHTKAYCPTCKIEGQEVSSYITYRK